MNDRPKLTHKLILLRVPNEQAERLDVIARKHGQETAQFVSDLLKPLLDKDADPRKWYMVAGLPARDYARLNNHRREIKEAGGRRFTRAELLELVASERLQELEP